ncbi:hypothetical protein ONE63_010338 [Megalurothrips usitatus]|uniref:Uncharacterized protein n=1 Tax=Megalurothrips usitatus TaxID=439358 RepID=A0AAV7XPG6_9NEOP|nr:hypothetical protein ONE63_010338 [Megalurothrips usitatus]
MPTKRRSKQSAVSADHTSTVHSTKSDDLPLSTFAGPLHDPKLRKEAVVNIDRLEIEKHIPSLPKPLCESTRPNDVKTNGVRIRSKSKNPLTNCNTMNCYDFCCSLVPNIFFNKNTHPSQIL